MWHKTRHTHTFTVGKKMAKYLKRGYIDTSQKEVFKPILDAHGAQKATRILVKAYLFFIMLRDKISFLEASYKSCEITARVTDKLQRDASLLTPAFLETSSLKDSVIEQDDKYYLVSRYINRPRQPLEAHYQLILDGESAYCKGVLFDCHCQNHRRSVLFILGKFEMKFYSKKAKKHLTTLETNCQPCRRINILKQENWARMGPVPYDRLSSLHPPFFVSSIDCLGPLYLQEFPVPDLKHLDKRPSKTNPRTRAVLTKTFVMSIVCHNTSCVKLYYMRDLSADSVIIVLMAHFSRHGRAVRIISDLASSFLHVYDQMKEELGDADKRQLDLHQLALNLWAGSQNVESVTMASQAAHVQGDVEEKNRWIKPRLEQVIKGKILMQSPSNFQHSLDCVSEWINSRPLASWGVQPNGNLITCQHFLIGAMGRLGSFPLTHSSPLMRRFEQANLERQAMFKLLHQYYHRQLTRNYRWQSQKGHVFKPGDIVLDVSIRKTSWRHYGVAQVQSIEPSKDGQVRWVNLRYRFYYSDQDRTCRRHVTKILLLLSVSQASKGMNIPDYFDEQGHKDKDDSDAKMEIEDMENPEEATDGMEKLILPHGDDDDPVKEDLSPTNYGSVKDVFEVEDKDGAEDNLLDKKSKIPSWDQLRRAYSGEDDSINYNPTFEGPDAYSAPVDDQFASPDEFDEETTAVGEVPKPEKPRLTTGKTPDSEGPGTDNTQPRRSTRTKKAVDYASLSNNIYLYHPGQNQWISYYDSNHFSKTVQSRAFRVLMKEEEKHDVQPSPVPTLPLEEQLNPSPVPSLPTEGQLAAAAATAAARWTNSCTADLLSSDQSQEEPIKQPDPRNPILPHPTSFIPPPSQSQTVTMRSVFSSSRRRKSRNQTAKLKRPPVARTGHQSGPSTNQMEPTVPLTNQKSPNRVKSSHSVTSPLPSQPVNPKVHQLKQTNLPVSNFSYSSPMMMENVVLKIFLLFLILWLLPGSHAVDQCQGALRFNIPSMQQAVRDFEGVLAGLDEIKTNAGQGKSTLSYQFYGGGKTVTIMDSRAVLANALTDSTTYDKLQDWCLLLGLTPLSFTTNQQMAIYEMMKDLDLPKIVLGVKADSHNVYFTGDGSLSHFKTKLNAVLDTDQKKKALKYIHYSVTKALVETVAVIDSPYTLTKYVSDDGVSHYHPFICQSSDQTTEEMLQLRSDIRDYKINKTDYFVQQTRDLQTLLADMERFTAQNPGDPNCPQIDLFQHKYSKLLPYLSLTKWPLVAPDTDQVTFMNKWKTLRDGLEDTPNLIKKARAMLQYSGIVPGRNDWSYILSHTFWSNLIGGQTFEIFIFTCMVVVFLFLIGLLICVRNYCCKHIPLTDCLKWVWSILPSVPTHQPNTENPTEDPPIVNEIVEEPSSFPMQVLSRNTMFVPSARRPERPARRNRHFEIIVTPAEVNTEHSAPLLHE